MLGCLMCAFQIIHQRAERDPWPVKGDAVISADQTVGPLPVALPLYRTKVGTKVCHAGIRKGHLLGFPWNTTRVTYHRCDRIPAFELLSCWANRGARQEPDLDEKLLRKYFCKAAWANQLYNDLVEVAAFDDSKIGTFGRENFACWRRSRSIIRRCQTCNRCNVCWYPVPWLQRAGCLPMPSSMGPKTILVRCSNRRLSFPIWINLSPPEKII